MRFISYAQNFEDVMLWRALKHIEKGTYVDVGAQHPDLESVSKAFYDNGWRGIHIEPVPAYAQLLRDHRPDEIVVQAAVSDQEGTLMLHIFPDTGLSTAVHAYASDHQSNRGFDVCDVEVPMMTLTTALQPLLGKDIHWLKIDVEGFEENVLKGWDYTIFRPWVMVVEATIPDSPDVNYERWDPILIKAGYQFVYFDGLNRFYLAQEHLELISAFSCPPNTFDNIRIADHSNLCCEMQSQLRGLQEELETVYNSTSWRITRFLRQLMNFKPSIGLFLGRIRTKILRCKRKFQS
jgi:FkbM family methyltransferase